MAADIDSPTYMYTFAFTRKWMQIAKSLIPLPPNKKNLGVQYNRLTLFLVDAALFCYIQRHSSCYLWRTYSKNDTRPMVDEGDGISALSNTNYTIIIENKMESTNYLYSLFIPCIVHQFSLDFCSIVMTQIK